MNRVERRAGTIKDGKRVNTASSFAKQRLINIQLDAREAARKKRDERVKELKEIKSENLTRKQIKELKKYGVAYGS